MIRLTTLFLFACFSFYVSAQEMAFQGDPSTDALLVAPAPAPAVYFADRMVPAFPAEEGNFADFIHQNLKYPELAQDYAVEGTVVVEVNVAKNGKVTYSRVAQSLFAPLDSAAIDLVRELPRFKPAARGGKAVAKKMMIPFKFSLR
ncbi:energy transducer TonB [Neolewinella antarctica]|uniref:Protein TonB n=1 Tax=Neolewinella antarctica TaxID=442734 RepID=A0ABX0XDN2_9BACT|nr:energy transducer TonB [Neolewinella antarctica]NJC27413.1 protein TonB [Neolewinella antarctica]